MMNHDIYNVWNGERFVFTLNKIAAISEGLLEVPECFREIADEPIAMICGYRLNPDPEKGLSVRFLPQYAQSNYNNYVSQAQKGVIMVSHVALQDAAGNQLPMIKVANLKAVQHTLIRIGAYMKRVCPMPTIALTGSVGKTTTTMFMESIFAEKYRVFVSGRNLNISEAFIERMLEDFGSSYDFHIQETGGGGPNVVEHSAMTLTPDAFAILNVFPHHLDKYKTVEGIWYDKSSLDRHAKENAFGIINIDDDILRNHKFQHRTVTCGIIHKEADYVAENIRQDGIYLRMDILHQGTRTPIQINIPGIHNAYNAVIAFAMAKEWGMSYEEIQAGFRAYTSRGIRQNLCEIAGRTMYIDCFNIAADSIRSCLKTLDSLEPKPGCRRIAVLSGENALGQNSFAVNYAVGLEMAKYKADEFIFVGLPETEPAEQINLHGDGRSVFEGARRVVRDRPVSYCDDLGKLADMLIRNTKPGDVILFKGIFRFPLFAAIDRAFGTSILIHEPMFTRQLWRSHHFAAHYYKEIHGSSIVRALSNQAETQIPNTIFGKPIYRIGKDVFRKRTDLTSIDFGLSLQNIGEQSFFGCTGLKELNIPANVIHVEQKAFANCTALESVNFDGVLHICSEAFANCKSLKTVYLTDSCQTIEPNAFFGCPNLTIVAPEGSVAHRYALENGISYKNT